MQKSRILNRITKIILILIWYSTPYIILKIFGRDNFWIMILAIILFHLPLLAFTIYVTFFYKTNYLAPWPVRKRSNWKPSKSDVFVDRFVRFTIVFALIFFFAKYGTRLSLDLYELAIYHTSIYGKYLVVYKDSPGTWRTPNYYMTVKLMGMDDQEFVIFFYSHRSIEKGKRYLFDILPRSGIILRARPSS